MVPRDQDARDMETSADELKTAAESDTESSEDKQTRKARWDMDHEEAEKRLLAAVARLSTAPITAPLSPVTAATETTPSASEEPQGAAGNNANEEMGAGDMDISEDELTREMRIAEQRDIEDYEAEKQMLAAM
ncbi:hypothetical protein C0991_010272, partial [Blastosporella zonata]